MALTRQEYDNIPNGIFVKFRTGSYPDSELNGIKGRYGVTFIDASGSLGHQKWHSLVEIKPVKVVSQALIDELLFPTPAMEPEVEPVPMPEAPRSKSARITSSSGAEYVLRGDDLWQSIGTTIVLSWVELLSYGPLTVRLYDRYGYLLYDHTIPKWTPDMTRPAGPCLSID